jgi:hypothetical protein
MMDSNLDAIRRKKQPKHDKWNAKQTQNFRNTGDIYAEPAYENFAFQTHDSDENVFYEEDHSEDDEDEGGVPENWPIPDQQVLIPDPLEPQHPECNLPQPLHFEIVALPPPPEFQSEATSPSPQPPDNIASRTRSKNQRFFIPPYNPFRSSRTQQQQRPRPISSQTRSRSAAPDLGIRSETHPILRDHSMPRTAARKNVTFGHIETFLNNLFRVRTQNEN